MADVSWKYTGEHVSLLVRSDHLSRKPTSSNNEASSKHASKMFDLPLVPSPFPNLHDTSLSGRYRLDS